MEPEYCPYPNCNNMLSPNKSVDYCHACGRKVNRDEIPSRTDNDCR